MQKIKNNLWRMRARAAINTLRWLSPGLGIKRWILLILVGTTLLGVGLAVLVLDVYRNAPETWWLPVLSWLSLRFLSRPLRALIFGGIGVGLILVGIWAINRTLLAPYTKHGKPVLETISSHRKRGRGPNIVAIGGGHGLSILLRGLKQYSHNITAVVTVADDGGSSGRIRQSMGILPPGDIRNCLAALSEDEALITQLFQYRFHESLDGLGSHSFGNLFISAMADITGSFEEAVAESGRVLGVHGRVLPATLRNVNLLADVALPNISAEVRIEGESRIPKTAGQVRRLWLEPEAPPAYPQVIRALLAADIILVGPGSLYTSILPNLLVPDIAMAIQASRALKIYICNVANQPGETDGYTARDYLSAIEAHVGTDLFDITICNQVLSPEPTGSYQWVAIEREMLETCPVYQAALQDESNPARHDPARLARVIMDLWEERTGPLVE
jgi:uncharacterized cofD-like protein